MKYRIDKKQSLNCYFFWQIDGLKGGTKRRQKRLRTWPHLACVCAVKLLIEWWRKDDEWMVSHLHSKVLIAESNWWTKGHCCWYFCANVGNSHWMTTVTIPKTDARPNLATLVTENFIGRSLVCLLWRLIRSDWCIVGKTKNKANLRLWVRIKKFPLHRLWNWWIHTQLRRCSSH